MRTKEIVEATGVSRETLRFYELKKLLDKPKRSASGYRDYSRQCIQRIKFILTAQKAGFTLNEIQQLIELKAKKLSCRQGRDMAFKKKRELQLRAKALQEIMNRLDKFIDICESEGESGLNRTCPLSFDLLTAG